MIVDLLPMSPVGGSGRISIEIPLSIDEHCTTITNEYVVKHEIDEKWGINPDQD